MMSPVTSARVRQTARTRLPDRTPVFNSTATGTDERPHRTTPPAAGYRPRNQHPVRAADIRKVDQMEILRNPRRRGCRPAMQARASRLYLPPILRGHSPRARARITTLRAEPGNTTARNNERRDRTRRDGAGDLETQKPMAVAVNIARNSAVSQPARFTVAEIIFVICGSSSATKSADG